MSEHRLFAASYDRWSLPVEVAGLARRRHRLVGRAKGRVLELGAGSGMNLGHYAATVTSLTALEPDHGLRKRLEARVAAAPRGFTIETVAAGIDDADLPRHAYDTVVATLVLCSVADLHQTLVRIRDLLAEDGSLLFLEHVKAPGSRAGMQRVAGYAWSRMLPGCHLDRDVTGALRHAGFAIADCERFELAVGNPLVSAAVQGEAIVSHQLRPLVATSGPSSASGDGLGTR